MKTPSFWQTRNKRALLLWPFSVVYEQVSTFRQLLTKPTQLTVPVVCIGNATAGGGGKTPFALHLGQMLKARGVNAYYLSRGYGGSLEGPVVVDAAIHSAAEVGDEPLLLARVLPTVIAKDRLQGAALAIKSGAKLIIMDDGLQNPAIAKDFSFLVVDGTVGFGNGFLLPAGPLRERPEISFKRAHSIVIINPQTTSPKMPKDDRVLLRARTRTHEKWQGLKGRRVVAFCGLAYPEKFKQTLFGLQANIVEFITFPDHHQYTEKELNGLFHLALKHGAFIASTEKDAVRMPARYVEKLAVIDIELVFETPANLDAQVDYIARLT